MNLKSKKVQKYWGGRPALIDYSQIDQSIIFEFKGIHPEVVKDWLPKSNGLFIADSSYKLTNKQIKHRIMIKIENFFGIDLSKKHFKLLK